MNVLLLNPAFRVKVNDTYERFFVRAGSRWPYSEYKKSKEPSLYRPFPFSLAYTAALLQKNGHSVSVIDGVALQYRNEEFLGVALSKSAEAIFIEIAPFSIQNDLDIARNLKKKRKDVVLIAVGPFVPLLLGYMEGRGAFDYAINGEYECAAAQIVENLQQGRTPDIRGVVDFNRQRAADKMSEFTESINPLDQLPEPLREIFPSNDSPDLNAYWDVFCQLKPAVQMHTSRGCPYKCYFCLWNQVVYKENKYRIFSIARVLDEMQHIMDRYRAREIYIDDDDFSIQRSRLSELCRGIRERRLKVKWSCMADAINLNDGLIREMAEAGCIGIKFGIESADAEVLRAVGKPIDLRRVEEIVSSCKKYGIRTHATFSFGLLNETKSSLKNSLEFAMRLDTDSVQFSMATPYPGTRFWDILKERGWIKEFDWMNYDGSCRSVVDYPGLSAQELEDFYNRAFSQWFCQKIKNFGWLMRQAKFSFRTLRSQSLVYNIRFLKRLILKLRS